MNELILFFILISLAGCFAGLLSGIIGVGGGVVVVPVLYYVLTGSGFSIDTSLHVAIGSSLATVAITQFRSALGHMKLGSFNKVIWQKWALPISVGALAGSVVAGFIAGFLLAFIFAIGMFLIACIMAYRAKFGLSHQHKPRLTLESLALYPIAFLSGAFSAITGVGGGTFNVSALTLIFRVNIREAIGVSSALGTLIGLCGAMVFVLTGWGEANNIPYSLGFVNLPSVLLVISFSILTAPLGVKLSRRMQQEQLQTFFAIMLIIAAINMFYEGWVGSG